MFRAPLTMNEQCPVCGHRFMREPGFFQGAMYVSYAMGVITFLLLLVFMRRALEARIGFLASCGAAFAVQLFLVPVLWRYSRVIWAHLNVGTRKSS